MRPLNPRLWSSTFSLLLIALLLGLIIAATAVSTSKANGPVWPAVAASVALSGVVATAIGVFLNYQRQKRQATIDAWLAWKDGSAAARAANFKTFGKTDLTEAQARALALVEGKLKDGAGRELDDQSRAIAARNISVVLNGLEGLAAGVYHGVYDIKIMNALGHTIIVDTTRRFYAYIKLRQRTDEKAKRQETAFEALCVLADHMDTLEERRRKRRSDNGVLSYKRGK